MDEPAGEGPATSSTEAKQNLGRGFLRTRHSGKTARPTEYQAIAKVSLSGEVDKREIRSILESNPRETAALRGAGFPDRKIAEILQRRE